MIARDWSKSPVKITFGDDMVITDVAVDKDTTLTLFTESWVPEKYDIVVTLQEKNK